MQDQDGSHFNVHGLWPDGTGSNVCTNPQTCSSIKYDESLLSSDLRSWMRKWYAGLYNDCTSFHAHEFEKHGTCWNSPSSDLRQWENAFFGEVKTQTTFYDILLAFKNAGITPSDTAAHQASAYVAAIRNQFKSSTFGIILNCQKISGKYYLQEVDLCLDLKYQPSKCLCTSMSGTCPSSENIYFPVFKHQ